MKKASLRDNMTLALNTLAEAYTTEISKQQNPETLGHHINVAVSGGNVAKVADNKKDKPAVNASLSRFHYKLYLTKLQPANFLAKPRGLYPYCFVPLKRAHVAIVGLIWFIYKSLILRKVH